MAKADGKVTIDSVNTQVGLMKNQLSYQWRVLTQIAERLGFCVDDEGEYLMDSDKSIVANMGQQQPGTTAVASASTPAMDITTFTSEFIDQLQTRPIPVDFGKQKVPIDLASLLDSNQVLHDRVFQPWHEDYGKLRTSMLKLFGYVEIDICGNKVLKVDEHPEIPKNHLIEDAVTDAPTETTLHSAFVGFRRMLWADMVSRFWKSFAYFIAILGFGFGCCQWYEQWQLSKEIQRYEVVRAYYNIFPEHVQIWDDMFTKIDKFGCDDMMKQVQDLKAQKEREEIERIKKQIRRKK